MLWTDCIDGSIPKYVCVPKSSPTPDTTILDEVETTTPGDGSDSSDGSSPGTGGDVPPGGGDIPPGVLAVEAPEGLSGFLFMCV